MEKNFHDGNFLVVDEISYVFRAPARGEAIVFKYPGNEKEYFVKRIIGLPGESLTVVDNVITITAKDGVSTVIDEPYIQKDSRIGIRKSVTLGENEYFVMGDNRGNSFDSRDWGPLERREITGVVRFRVFPFSQFGIIHPQEYK
jgi:signal peptidase I